jgi:hypothetical protein
MHFVVIPDPVEVPTCPSCGTIARSGPNGPLSRATVTFANLVLERWLAEDAVFGRPAEARRGQKIAELVAEAKGPWIAFEDSDWALLKRAAMESAVPYNATVLRAILPMLDALLDASTTQPKPKLASQKTG